MRTVALTLSLGCLVLLAACASPGVPPGGPPGGHPDGGGNPDGGGTVTPVYHSYSLPSAAQSVAIDASGNVWVSCANVGSGGVVVKLSPSGTKLGTYTLPMVQSATSGAYGLAIDSSGNVWVSGTVASCPSAITGVCTSAGNPHDSITKLSSSGAVLQDVLLPSFMGTSTNVAIDRSGNIWVADQDISSGGAGGNNNHLFEVSSSGSVLATINLGNPLPAGLAIDASSNLWITDGSGNVMKIAPSGTVLGTFAVSSTNNLAVDASGNVWTSGGANGIATMLSSSGSVIRVAPAPGGSAGFPWGLALDSGGHVWLSNTSGPVSEVDAATGQVLQQFYDPSMGGALSGMAVDPAGNVWIAGYSSNNVIEISGAGRGPEVFPYTGPIFPL